MGTIKYDIDTISNNVIPILESVLDYLDSVSNTFSKITIPSSFCYSSLLSNIERECTERKRGIEDIKKSLLQSVEDFQNVENKNKNFLQELWDKIFGGNDNLADVDGSENDSQSELVQFALWQLDVQQQQQQQQEQLAANATNAIIALAKGVASLVEDIVDAFTVMNAVNPGMFIGGEWISIPQAQITNEEYLKDVMEFVSEDHVDNAFNDFYENTVVGVRLDEMADSIFEHDGVACQIAEEVGYIAGIAVTGMAGTSVTVAVAGTAAFGKYTAEHWAESRDNSWQGIQQKYESGELSEEEYLQLVNIRSLSIEEVTVLYEQGSITLEDYETIKQIIEMPEEWTTEENRQKGILYGAANAAWEAVQWAVGIGLDDLVIKGASKLTNSVVRVGIDTLFNGADPAYRALVDVTTSDRTFQEAWERQGGWTSVVTSVGVGLIGSVGGEVINANKVDDVFEEKKQLVDIYLDNIEEYSAKGISIEQFFVDNGFKIIDNKTKLAAAETLGDSKLYMMEARWENEFLEIEQLEKYDDIIREYRGTRVGNLDAKDMLRNLQEFMSEEQIETVERLMQDGVSDKLASGYTDEQLAAIFNYTACGGFEINAWLNDTYIPGSTIKARESWSTVGEIQNIISGYTIDGIVNNRVFNTTQGDILECLDSVIASANYDNPIVTYRGVKKLFDGNTEIDPKQLKIGDSFSSSGYQSSSVVMNNCFGMRMDDTNIILRVIVPPKSGTAAYIENITGVRNHNQMEMLIKRDATMTVVGDIEIKDVNGVIKLIIPVIVQ